MKIGFIDYYLDEWHANNYPRMLREQSQGRIRVAYAYGMIPSPHSGMTSRQWCEKYEIQYCETIEELIEKSDALVVLSPDNCEMHEELSKLALASGKKTYIDKTFAPTLQAAKNIFAMANAGGSPCYSSSALRFAEQYQAYMGMDIQAAAFRGPNDVDVYSVHLLEPMMMLMKGKVKRAIALTQGDWANVLYEWEDGRNASMLCTGGDSPFAATLKLKNECVNITAEGNFFESFIDALIKFFEEGIMPVSQEETLSIMAAREAAIKAMEQPGVWVYTD